MPGGGPPPLAPQVPEACCQKDAEPRAEECIPGGPGQGLSPVVDLLGDGVAVLVGIYGRWGAQRVLLSRTRRSPRGRRFERIVPTPGPMPSTGCPSTVTDMKRCFDKLKILPIQASLLV